MQNFSPESLESVKKTDFTFKGMEEECNQHKMEFKVIKTKTNLNLND